LKIKLTKEEVLSIVENHLIVNKGYNTKKVALVHIDKKDYEYYGDPTRQDRREITGRYFDGIEAEIEFDIK
jgi:hypothetical protein